MKKYFNISFQFLILFLFVFQSCEKVINLDIEESDKKIVLNSVVSTDETIIVNLTKSKSIIDDSDIEYIDNAVIILTENDNVISSHTYNGNGNYIFNKIAEIGKTYKIKVNAENLKEINAETKLLAPNNFEVTDTFTTNYDGEDYLAMIIRIENTDDNSYFFIEALNENGDNVYLDSYDIKSEKNILGDYLLFNNQIPGSGNIDFQFYLSKYIYDYGSGGQSYGYIYLVLHRVSEAFYKYYLSSNMQKQVGGSPFAEPVQIYNNIENGFGIFGSESYSLDSIEIK